MVSLKKSPPSKREALKLLAEIFNQQISMISSLQAQYDQFYRHGLQFLPFFL